MLTSNISIPVHAGSAPPFLGEMCQVTSDYGQVSKSRPVVSCNFYATICPEFDISDGVESKGSPPEECSVFQAYG